MCDDCRHTAIEAIADTVIKGYNVDAATRLYRDAVLQRYLEDPAGNPATMLKDMRALSGIATDAGSMLEAARDTQPEVYEGLLMVRTMLSMISEEP